MCRAQIEGSSLEAGPIGIGRIGRSCFRETDVPINGPSVARRRVVKIGLIVAIILFVASLVARAIDIYQTHQSISPAAIASLALGALGVVIAGGAFFYAVWRRK